MGGSPAVCLSHTHTFDWSSPSTERCERRASRATLALVDELTGATSSGSCPALTSICWPWSTCSANSKESSPRPSMRPTSWGSARNRRARTVVEALEAPALVPLVTSPRPRCCPVRSQARQGGRLARPVVLTRAAHNSDTWRGRPQSTPAPSALQCDSRTQSNGRSLVARSCPLRLVLLFVEPMQATRMSSKDASSVGRPSARSHASLLAHHLKRSAYTPKEGTSFGSLFDGVGENDGR